MKPTQKYSVGFAVLVLVVLVFIGLVGILVKKGQIKNSGQTSVLPVQNLLKQALSPKQNMDAAAFNQQQYTDVNSPVKKSEISHPAVEKLKEKVSMTAGKSPRQQAVEVEKFLADFNSASTVTKKLELIDSLTPASVDRDPCIIPIVQKVLQCPDSEVGLASIELLDGYQTSEILPVVSRALKLPDEDIRQKALMTLENVNDPQAASLLIEALNDQSEVVRAAALEAAKGQNNDNQIAVITKAIDSPYGDVKSQAVLMALNRSDCQAVEILIEGLKDTNLDFREQVSQAIDGLIGQEFDNYQQAKSWWQQNKNRYDDNLFEVED